MRISPSATTCEKRFPCTLSSSSSILQSGSIRLFLCRALSSIHIRLQWAMHFSSLALTSSPAFTKVLFILSNNRSSSLDGKCKPARRSFYKASPSVARNAATRSRFAALSMSMSSMDRRSFMIVPASGSKHAIGRRKVSDDFCLGRGGMSV